MTDPACLTLKQAAARLGLSTAAFYKRRSRLEAEGFPKIDDVLGRYLTEDVDAWLKNRRQVRDLSDTVQSLDQKTRINFDAL